MTYGINAPQGLQPRKYQGGSTFSGQFNSYLIASGYATSLFIGDPVQWITHSGSTVGGTLVIGTTGNGILGVFGGCRYQDSAGNFIFSSYWPASTVTWNPGSTGNVPAIAYVYDDANILFDIQCSGTAAQTGSVNTIKQVDIGYNYNFHSGSGSTFSGMSGYYLDLASQNTTSTLNLKLMSITQAPGNDFGITYNNGMVLINNDITKGGTGTTAT